MYEINIAQRSKFSIMMLHEDNSIWDRFRSYIKHQELTPKIVAWACWVAAIFLGRTIFCLHTITIAFFSFV
jgi:hypothetical protein